MSNAHVNLADSRPFQWSRAAVASLPLGFAAVAGAGNVCPCLGDLDANGAVDAADLAIVLGSWGNCGNCVRCLGDISGDCKVDGLDLGILLGNWGPCNPIPDNDHCANATVIVNGTGSANPFCTFGADTDGPSTTCGVPSITSINGDVWFKFTASLTGTAQLGVCADFDVRMAVYGQNVLGGCSCPGDIFPPALIGCSGTESFPVCPGGKGTALLVPVEAGECYKIRIGGAPGQLGSGHLDINFYVQPCEISNNLKVSASGLEANTEFGIGVDISDDVGVAGAIFDDLPGATNAGSARVYRYNGTTWTTEQTLTSPAPFDTERFGVNVAISGNYIVVGAGDGTEGCSATPGCDSGKGFVYHYDGAQWNYDQSLTQGGGNGSPEDQFGTRVDIDGLRIIVGADTDDNVHGDRAGAAYIYSWSPIFGGIWLLDEKLMASDGDNFDEFGSDVAISGDWAIVGASGDENGGSAYLFQRVGADWNQVLKLHPAGLAATADLGYAVAIDGNIALVGAPDFNNGPGKVYVYENFPNGGWLLAKTLVAHDGVDDDAFGSALSVSDKQVMIGASGAMSARGAAYLFWRVNGGWVERAKLLASDGVAGDGFAGAGVAIHNGLALIGAYLDNVGIFTDLGSVYRFNGLWECTGNGVADACDIADGLPDSDGDGIPNVCEP